LEFDLDLDSTQVEQEAAVGGFVPILDWLGRIGVGRLGFVGTSFVGTLSKSFFFG